MFDEATGCVTGCGTVEPLAGDLIAEAMLAIEMDANAADVALTIYPHPTLSEAVDLAFEAFEAFEGRISDPYLPRGRDSSSPVGVQALWATLNSRPRRAASASCW